MVKKYLEAGKSPPRSTAVPTQPRVQSPQTPLLSCEIPRLMDGCFCFYCRHPWNVPAFFANPRLEHIFDHPGQTLAASNGNPTPNAPARARRPSRGTPHAHASRAPLVTRKARRAHRRAHRALQAAALRPGTRRADSTSRPQRTALPDASRGRRPYRAGGAPAAYRDTSPRPRRE